MKTRSTLFVGLLACMAASLSAQVTFTFSGTVTQASLGYNLNDAVSFTFTTTSNFPNTGSSFFGNMSGVNYAVWMANTAADGSLWSSVSGTGLSGSYAPATGDARFDNILLEDDKPTTLLLAASSDTGAVPLGTLLTPGSQPVTDIGYADSNNAVVGPTFTPLPASYVGLESFFSGYNATYTGLSYGFAINSVGFSSAVFTMDTLTISAVPEPATYALCAGLLGLGLVLRRRFAT